MQITNQQINKFQKQILSWYEINKRDLPWREVPVGISLQDAQSGNLLQQRAYQVLVSEVMSQQTQISRVVPKFEAWIQKFPTIIDLAKASVSDVLLYWSGLGYNRRALNLKKAAEIIVKEYGGIFPQDEKQLLKLPGIGEYTARALLCFAFNKQVAVVDTNVRKVILTQFFHRHPEQSEGSLMIKDSSPSAQNDKEISDKEIEDIAQMLLPVGKAYEWNQALMDYATAMLKKEKIPISKQSKFVGSRRYYRGQVLKILLTKKRVTVSELGFLIKKDYTNAEEAWLKSLVKELITEGFIVEKNNFVHLAS